MKLLSVANVANIVGGTSACAWTMMKSLPDWEHHVTFTNSGNGVVPPDVVKHFGCPVSRKSKIIPADLEEIKPDVIIYHNTGPMAMPNVHPDTILRFYYQHSRHGAALEARRRCHLAFAASRYLGDLAQIGREFVLHQPCPRPPKRVGVRGEGLFRVGRICTPIQNKWQPGQIFPLYERLGKDNPDIEWHFVGCPSGLRDKLTELCNGQTVFHQPAWSARSLLWEWDAYLYSCGVTETYGRIVCEAQRAGCVPIVDSSGGFVEQISNGVDGFLCDDIAAFEVALKQVQNQDIWRDVSNRATQAGDRRGSLQGWREKFLAWCAAVADAY